MVGVYSETIASMINLIEQEFNPAHSEQADFGK